MIRYLFVLPLLIILHTSAPAIGQVGGHGNQPVATEVAPDLRQTVTQFVTSEFTHGVPFEEARALGPQAVPILAELLAAEAMTSHRPNIVTTIAFVGGPGVFRILHAFLWDTFDGDVDGSTYRALVAVQSVLGFVRSPEVVPYLQKGVDPDYWSRLRWSYGTKRGEKLGVLLSKLTINGLSYTGDPRALESLRKLEAHPLHPRQLPNIREGITRHEAISSVGIEEYLRSPMRESR